MTVGLCILVITTASPMALFPSALPWNRRATVYPPPRHPAQTLLARTGAALHFENIGRGARVTIIWRRAASVQLVPEALI
jgi:hypothetical protein